MKQILLALIAGCCLCNTSAQQTVGLLKQTGAAEDGYVLFSPMFAKDIYLIDKCGKKVHSWNSKYLPGISVYLQPDGNLFRPGITGNPVFNAGGTGGVIEMLDWNSNANWEYVISDPLQCQHHDICPLPNGNVLAIVWELKTAPEAVTMGRRPAQAGTVWSEKIVELRPMGRNNAMVVWEWHVWDHLVQDQTAAFPGYGNPSDHPELIDINHAVEAARADWLHINSVSYNADLDQIILSAYFFNEFWIIDHSTTPQEAASHTGGRSGKGGDLLYRWGNPQAYGRGTAQDRKFYAQHDAHWIPAGYPDGGKIMVFNNGQARPEGPYSSVEIVAPPLDSAGNYALPASTAYGPANASWIYTGSPKEHFFSPIISGASRLSNGNTMITEGTKGNLIEVDTSGTIVWQYVSPVDGGGAIVDQGTVPVTPNVFRCYQYPLLYSGFMGHPLTPGAPLEGNPLPYNCFTAEEPTAVSPKAVNTVDYTVTNPFSNSIVLTSSADGRDVQMTLLNSLGMLCGQWDAHLNRGVPANIAIAESLPAGIYFLRIKDGGRQTTVRLIRN